jgi:hypothetical protein
MHAGLQATLIDGLGLHGEFRKCAGMLRFSVFCTQQVRSLDQDRKPAAGAQGYRQSSGLSWVSDDRSSSANSSELEMTCAAGVRRTHLVSAQPPGGLPVRPCLGRHFRPSHAHQCDGIDSKIQSVDVGDNVRVVTRRLFSQTSTSLSLPNTADSYRNVRSAADCICRCRQWFTEAPDIGCIVRRITVRDSICRPDAKSSIGVASPLTVESLRQNRTSRKNM